MPVKEIMLYGVITVSPDESVSRVMNLMTHRRVRHMPVLRDGKLAGIISIGDVVKHRLDDLELETRTSCAMPTSQHVDVVLFRRPRPTSAVSRNTACADRPDRRTSAAHVRRFRPSSIEYIRVGKLRALAVTTAARSEVLPEIPTVGEFVPGYEASGWIGVGTPKATPAEIVDNLDKEINAALADPKIRGHISDLGSRVFASSPAEFTNFIAAETEKWGRVVKFARIKPQ